MTLFPDLDPATLIRRRRPVAADTLVAAAAIVEAVRDGGEAALREQAERFDGPSERLFFDRDDLEQARARLEPEVRALLERVAGRIESFAAAQRGCLHELDIERGNLRMGHRLVPLERVGAYAPGGRHAYPSSVLMTVVPAKVAGVAEVVVASPRPSNLVLGAAAVAGADQVLGAGGAQAIAALAFGAGLVSPCDAVVGPGNRWVTAAKQLIAGEVRIDGLAGPSELVVLADASSDPGVIAADLLAQAEHDPEALPVLISTNRPLIAAVRAELALQLETLPTAATARQALATGGAVLVADLDAGVELCQRLAPEHLEVLVADPDPVVTRLDRYGGLFVGAGAGEVFGDYGAGPNHVLPTGGSARSFSGLSVLTFLRAPTHIRAQSAPSPEQIADAAALAELEGLAAHAAAARRRSSGQEPKTEFPSR